MPDVFNRRPLTVGNSFAADSAVINFSGGGLAPGNGNGLLVQNMGFQYQQQVTRLYELGSQLTYYVAGRPQGQGNIGRVLGPGPVVIAFYSTYGDVCKAKGNNINIFASAYCGDPCTDPAFDDFGPAFFGAGFLPGIRWCITGVVLNTVGMTIAAQDMIMNETLGFMFVALEVCQVEQTTGCWPVTACCEADATD